MNKMISGMATAALLLGIMNTAQAAGEVIRHKLPDSAFPIALAASTCRQLTGCERKVCEIERQLTMAQKTGNAHKVNGLRKALHQVKRNCTDSGMRSHGVQDKEQTKTDLAEYEADLKSAAPYGKIQEMRKYQEKIEQ